MLVSLHYKYKLRPRAPYATEDKCLTLSLRSEPERGLSRPPPFPSFSSPSPSSSSFPFPSCPEHLSRFVICKNRWCFKALKIFNLHFLYFHKVVCCFQFPGSMMSSLAREPHMWLNFPGTCFSWVWMSCRSRFHSHPCPLKTPPFLLVSHFTCGFCLIHQLLRLWRK